jgi:Na+-transporting NADH:ubiquinone oxidoreductase subunit NqrC
MIARGETPGIGEKEIPAPERVKYFIGKRIFDPFRVREN